MGGHCRAVQRGRVRPTSAGRNYRTWSSSRAPLITPTYLEALAHLHDRTLRQARQQRVNATLELREPNAQVMMQPSGERADASVDDAMGRADHNTDYTRQRIRGDEAIQHKEDA